MEIVAAEVFYARCSSSINNYGKANKAYKLHTN